MEFGINYLKWIKTHLSFSTVEAVQMAIYKLSLQAPMAILLHKHWRKNGVPRMMFTTPLSSECLKIPI